MEAPKVAGAAAIIAAIWMASAISDAMIVSLVCSTSSAASSQDLASFSHASSSFARAESPLPPTSFHSLENASPVSPSTARLTWFAPALPASWTFAMPSPAVRHASAIRRMASSSPSGQDCPTTIGNSHLTSSGISMLT
ncbi:hypothetical protein EIL87_04520 [Saccharopolyspora rhizosphaerae]|uniref:Uncharacterized protein n=1 Tax=Saccharopolyspora rhizosphaerae TaxID=2492662 RepID=A0A3R8Q658_9PSEU|nr:hypothetical protein [Saccharopolyspora rhizosphaerae]RRO19369.1 hypothetical protein EIL87_04520 [Saccharopolyspora rhizosphaerae]